MRGDVGKVLSVSDATGLPAGAVSKEVWLVVIGVRALTAQRNAALEAIEGNPVVVFFNEDATIRDDNVENVTRFFAAHPGSPRLPGPIQAYGLDSLAKDRSWQIALIRACGERGNALLKHW